MAIWIGLWQAPLLTTYPMVSKLALFMRGLATDQRMVVRLCQILHGGILH